MVHPDVFPKTIVSTDSKSVYVKEVYVDNQFTNGQEFECRDKMLQWTRIEESKFGFGVIIRMSDNDLDRRVAFVTMR